MKYSLVTLVSLTILLIGNAAYSQSPCQAYTPNSSLVGMYCFYSEPLSAAQIATFNQDADQQFPQAYRVGSASGKYNCHSYAWFWTSSSNYAWMNNPNDDVYWNDGSFSQTYTWGQSTHISYASDDHSGRNLLGNPGWIYSKWGNWPRMVHWYNDTPYISTSIKLYN